jgi:FkbM family methyltransferase
MINFTQTHSILDSGFAMIKETRYGYMLYNKNDMYIGRSFDLYGEFSYFESEIFTQIIKPGMCVLDIGANIGAFTTVFSKLVGENGIVYAFEPQRVVFQMLCANIAINSIENVFTYHSGVGSSKGTMMMPKLLPYVFNNFGGTSASVETKDKSLSVNILKLDDLAISECHFLKIDVEGMENEVLLGGEKMIRKYTPIMYVENDRVEKSETLISTLKKFGYKLYVHNPALFNPNNFFKQSKNIFGNIVSKNLLCIHKDRSISVEGLSEL